VKELLEEISRKTDWPRGSVEQVIGDHYASCMDEASIEATGLAPLSLLLADIDGARTPADVQRVIRRLHELAVPVPFGVASAPDYHDPARTIANVVAGESRKAEKARVVLVLSLGGVPEAEAGAAAEAALALEKRLVEASLDAATAGDPAATDHMMTFAELERLAPHVEWSRYFDAARLPRLDVNVSEPKLLRQVDAELSETPIATWRAYLKWHLLESLSPSLTKAFIPSGETRPRAERCVESTETLFGESVGRKYAERYFPPAAKAKAQEIGRNLLAVLSDEVARVEWMAPDTRKKALEKLAATDLEIGYPDTWTSIPAVVRRDACLSNVAAGRRLLVDEDRRQIGKPTKRDLWALPPSSPDAYLDLQLNKVVLPAGFLQPPYFDAGATDAVNYGSLGIGLAHDLTHAIDRGGSETDVTGRPRSWWTDADRKEFEGRAQCVLDQFEGYFIEPGVHHQGKRVLSEAIGDLAGVRVAYRALEKSMESRPVPVLDGFTPEQQFFIAWGQTTGASMRIEAQRELVSSDPHPVPRFRVIGPLSNSPEFQRAFSCRAGAPMVRPPEKRCGVW
jgi:endothelin-converting enzyme/putative endopeptidase